MSRSFRRMGLALAAGSVLSLAAVAQVGKPPAPAANFPAEVQREIDETMRRLPRTVPESHRRMIRRQIELKHRLMDHAGLWQDQLEAQMQRLPGAVPGAGLPPGGPPEAGQESPLGARFSVPTPALAEQLDLPSGQGLLVEDVLDQSPAAQAGLKRHDVLLELAGDPVPDDLTRFGQLLQAQRPGAHLDALVLRKGRKENVKGLRLPQAQNQAAPGAKTLPIPEGLLDGKTGVMTVLREKERFTATFQQGDLKLTLTGQLKEGKPELHEVILLQGERESRHATLDGLAPAQRTTGRDLLEMTAQCKSRFQMQVR